MTDSAVLKSISANRCFNGVQYIYEHTSSELKCSMKFAAYIPDSEDKSKLPVLIWLSGLTCNEQNFITKSGFHKYASEHKIIVIAPDTSPRGCNIDGDTDRWDFGVGAGFYVDATEPKWKENYRMYSYINVELHDVIKKNFSNGEDNLNVSIFGHSMGGHGALISFLKNPNKYKSVSAFAPIANPSKCDWGKFAFKGYLGEEESKWTEFDATCLIDKYDGPKSTILIDQGEEDSFLKQDQLCPNNFVQKIDSKSGDKTLSVSLRMQKGYDHSYYFISTFIEDHFKFHAERLNNKTDSI